MRHQRLLTVIIASVIALLVLSGTIILNFTDLEWRGVIGWGLYVLALLGTPILAGVANPKPGRQEHEPESR